MRGSVGCDSSRCKRGGGAGVAEAVDPRSRTGKRGRDPAPRAGEAVAPGEPRLAAPWRWAGRAPTVLQLVPDLGESEMSRAALDAARGLRDAGGYPLVATAGGRLEPLFARHGIEVMRLPLDANGLATLFRNAEHIAATAHDRAVDIIHARAPGPAWSALTATRRTAKPVLASVHHAYAPGNPLTRFKRAAMAGAHRLAVVSDHIGGHMADAFAAPRARLRRVPAGIDVRAFDPGAIAAERIMQLAERWQLPEDRKIVMLPGRLEPGKGHRHLLTAIARLRRSDICCVFLGGPGQESRLQRQLEEDALAAGLGDSVRIVEACHDMPAAYMLADVVAAPATEPPAFARVPLEAQAMARPVVAAAHGGASEGIDPARTGWLVPPGEPEPLAEALAAALDLSPAARDELGAAARAHVSQHFARPVAVHRQLAVYDELQLYADSPEAGERHLAARLDAPAP